MISDKVVFYTSMIVMATLIGCGSSDESQPINNNGINYLFRNVSPQKLIVKEYTLEGDKCQGIELYVRSLSDEKHLKGDPFIEQQLQTLVDSWTFQKGALPIVIEYTTEICQSIRLTLFDKNDVMLTDVTDMARIHYPKGLDAGEKIFLFSSQKKLLGQVSEGCSIAEYLANQPLLFTHAVFIFPDLNRDIFDKGNYVKVEIVLGNENILTVNLSL